MTEDVQFECTACHKDFHAKPGEAMTECRLCGKIHCADCVDEFGRCVACAAKEKPKDES